MAEEGSSSGFPQEDLRGIPAVGERVGGKFEIERVLGVGGMGVVVAARHVQLGQRVAIKFLRRDAARHSEAVSRFLREAKSVVGLQSAHVVRVMDVGVTDDGLPYMVMEHLSGADLGELMDRRKQLPVEEAVDYVLQGMEAVAEAHALGIVHRDIKPANLFLTTRPDGSPLVKVLDFGISKAVEGGAGDHALTATSAIMGSPMYMSPEQLRSSKNVDARTDIWALGVVLYELTAGVAPFVDETVTGLCSKIAADPPVPLRSVRPDVPVELESVVMRCLEKDVTRRPQTVGELATGLKPFASAEARLAVDRIVRMSGGPRAQRQAVPEGPAAPVSVPGSVHGSTGYADTVATWQTAGGIRRRRRATVVAAVVGGLVLVGAVVTVLWPARGTKAAAVVPPAGPDSTVVIVAPQPPSVPALEVVPPPSTTPSATPVASTSASAPKPSWSGAPRPTPRPATPPSKPPDDLLLDRK
jgi:serine/threonine-protein kinase